MSVKARIRFAKTGASRFLSHHDLMRAFERMLRRAELPFKSSEGFHPKPRMAFASALGLGIVGREEVVEIKFVQELRPEEIRSRLAAETPTGLAIENVTLIPTKNVGRATRATYVLRLAHVEPGTGPNGEAVWGPGDRQRLQSAILALLRAQMVWVDRERPHKKRIDVRPYVVDLALASAGLTMTLAITPQGAARPEEVLAVLGLGDALLNGAILERTRLVLADESVAVGNGPPAPPDDEPELSSAAEPRALATQ
jgi:radical SAM-linked protein